MPAVYEHHHTVAADEIDLNGHVNNLRYLHWALDAAVAHSRAQGWGRADYERLGAIWVVRSHAIKYLQSALLGDDVVVRTWVTGMKKFSSTRKYRMVRVSDNLQLAAAETEWVLVDIASRGLAKIPAELINSFTIVEQP